MKVHALQCKKCKDIIFSRAHHDCHHCTCGATMIDGGFDYMRCGFDPKVGESAQTYIEVKQTKKQLYDDWNCKKGKFGLIKGVTK